MQIFKWDEILESLETGRAPDFFSQGVGISVGSFDGLHRGHRLLLDTLASGCRRNGLVPGVVTFLRPLPSIKHSEDYSGDISTMRQRIRLLAELGMEFAITVDFDDSFASMLGTDFLGILMNVCNMEFLAEGVDFRCGYKGATDTQAISYFARQHNIKTEFLEPVFYRPGTQEEERISSSYIRQMVQKGFFTTVRELLERPYELDFEGTATTGNVIPRDLIQQVLPPDGLYHCKSQTGEDVRTEITARTVVLDSAGPVSTLRFG